MSGHGLGRTAEWMVWKKAVNRFAFHDVIVRRPCAVQVNIVDITRDKPGIVQRGAHGRFSASPFGLRGRNMIRIRTFPAAQKRDFGGFSAHDKQRHAFADVDSVAVEAERI